MGSKYNEMSSLFCEKLDKIRGVQGCFDRRDSAHASEKLVFRRMGTYNGCIEARLKEYSPITKK